MVDAAVDPAVEAALSVCAVGDVVLACPVGVELATGAPVDSVTLSSSEVDVASSLHGGHGASNRPLAPQVSLAGPSAAKPAEHRQVHCLLVVTPRQSDTFCSPTASGTAHACASHATTGGETSGPLGVSWQATVTWEEPEDW